MTEFPADLPTQLATKIRAPLLRVHSKKLEGADLDSCLRESYDAIASAIANGGEVLRDDLLSAQIPAWVFHWAVAKGWVVYPITRDLGPRIYRLGDTPPPRFEVIPENELNDILGEYKITSEVRTDFIERLNSRIVFWQAEALTITEKQNELKARSPLRQYLEAYKEIKKLTTGPRERIPESVVRLALSQQYSVKPEEVTWDQIRFEITGLFDDYPAIEVIPSTPPAESVPTELPDLADCKATRKTQVDAFLKACNECSQERIYKRHIWKSVGHTTARQFEYWQACDRKGTPEDQRNFGRTLAMTPAQFVETLRRQKLLPQS